MFVIVDGQEDTVCGTYHKIDLGILRVVSLARMNPWNFNSTQLTLLKGDVVFGFQ